MVKAVSLVPLYSHFFPLCLSSFPQLITNDSIVLAFSNQRIINLYPMILISGSLNLFDVLIAISVVAKRLARKLQNEQKGESQHEQNE